MANTVYQVISFYEGTEDVQDILVDLITEKIKRNMKLAVQNTDEKDYNKGTSVDDLPGLAG